MVKFGLVAEIFSLVCGTPANFNGVIVLAYCSDVAQRSQPSFARCLAVSWAGTLYIHFPGLLPRNGILPGVKFTFCVQVLRSPIVSDIAVFVLKRDVKLQPTNLRSPILPALLHSTRAAAISQILWRGTSNEITELSLRAPPIFGWAAITLGIGPHSSFFTDVVNTRRNR